MSDTFLTTLIRDGYGISPRSQVRLNVALYGRVPDLPQRLIAPKLSNLRSIEDVVENPDEAGPCAVGLYTAKHSPHRNVVRNHDAKLTSVAFGQVMALPGEAVGVKVVEEAANDRGAIKQRVLLLGGIADRVPTAELRSMARKGILAAADQVVSLCLMRGLIDFPVVRFNIPDSDDVRVLRSFRDMIEHGDRQDNCMGEEPLLRRAARGQMLYFEVVIGNRVYSASMPVGAPWKVDLVEGAGHREPPERRSQRVAAMVEAVVHEALGRKAA